MMIDRREGERLEIGRGEMLESRFGRNRSGRHLAQQREHPLAHHATAGSASRWSR